MNDRREIVIPVSQEPRPGCAVETRESLLRGDGGPLIDLNAKG